jgi:hypothetical protein
VAPLLSEILPSALWLLAFSALEFASGMRNPVFIHHWVKMATA